MVLSRPSQPLATCLPGELPGARFAASIHSSEVSEFALIRRHVSAVRVPTHSGMVSSLLPHISSSCRSWSGSTVVCVCMCVYVCVYAYIFVCVCVYIYTYIHEYIL
jgi:hypothetical protein